MNNQCFRYSDHLPVTMSIGGLKFGSWNVLFQKWLIMNSGPKGDGHITKYFNQLATMDKTTRKTGILLTIYDLLKVQNISVLGLQEFDPSYLDDLKQLLYHLGNYEIVLPSDLNGYDKANENTLTSKDSNDLQIVIYHRAVIIHNVQKSHMEYYVNSSDGSKKIAKRIMNLSLSDADNVVEFRFINTHVLFMQMKQLVTYINNIKKPSTQKELYVIVVGDMNQTERPNDLQGIPKDGTLTVYNGHDRMENLKYTHINTQGDYVMYDHIWWNIIK